MTYDVVAKCDTASNLHAQVKSVYAIYYADPSPDPDIVSTRVDALVTCSNTLDTQLAAIRTAAGGAVTSQLSNTSNLLVSGNMSCSLDRLINLNSIFEKWADGVKAISDGAYIDRIIEKLQWCLAAERSADELVAKVCGAGTDANEILNKIAQLLATLNSFINTVNSLASALSVLSLAQACDAIVNKMYNLRQPLGDANPNVALALDCFSEGRTQLGNAAPKGTVAAYAKGRFLEETGTTANLEAIGASLASRTAALNS